MIRAGIYSVLLSQVAVLALCLTIALGGDLAPLATFSACWGGAIALALIDGSIGLSDELDRY